LTKKKIVFLTGTRADFGKLKPLIEEIEKSKLFECFIFVTGMHTLSKYGSTFHEIKKQKYKNMFIFMNQTHTTDQDLILANTVIGFGNFVKEVKPDLIVIHGDRTEALAGAIVGSFNNILVGHVEGGEVSGTIDEIIRHTISKLSHIHFVANKKAKKRLLQLGESGNSIFVIGSPDVDVMKSKNLPTISQVKKRYGIHFKKYAILIYHPVTTELDSLQVQISQVVSSVIDSGMNYVVIYPNNDTGSDIIIQEYKKLKFLKNFKIFYSLRFEYFLSLLKNSEFIIGNSSVGIRESGVYGIPAINIGSRQQNRTKNKMVTNVNPKASEIKKEIKKGNKKTLKPNYEFGDGKSSKKFLELLKDKKSWGIKVQKSFVDL